MKHHTILMGIALMLCYQYSIGGRSPLRKKDPLMPELSISWDGSSKILYTIKDSHLEPYPIFAFNAATLSESYALPKDQISHIKDSGASSTTELNALIQEVVKDVRHHKRSYKHFKVLQDKNFNYTLPSGLLVLKFNDHPFVLKLFIESPESLFNIYSKGVEPMVFFYMSGGSNRHITGISRLYNREHVLRTIDSFDRWKSIVHIPRKWFWVPADEPWMSLVGKHIGDVERREIKIPGTYAIIADAIDTKQTAKIDNSSRRKMIMDFCNDLKLFIDPHTNNFVFYNDPITQEIHFIIVDTEHFPSSVGFKEPIAFDNHVEWFLHLTGKFLKDAYFRTKDQRKAAQTNKHELALIVPR